MMTTRRRCDNQEHAPPAVEIAASENVLFNVTRDQKDALLIHLVNYDDSEKQTATVRFPADRPPVVRHYSPDDGESTIKLVGPDTVRIEDIACYSILRCGNEISYGGSRHRRYEDRLRLGIPLAPRHHDRARGGCGRIRCEIASSCIEPGAGAGTSTRIVLRNTLVARMGDDRYAGPED